MAGVVGATHVPRVLIITDHTAFGRVLEHHISIVWHDAQCRLHSPAQSGRLHPDLAAIGYDLVLLDADVERGMGSQWLTDLVTRRFFPPIVYLAANANEVERRVLSAGAAACVTRGRVDHAQLAAGLHAAIARREKEQSEPSRRRELEQSYRFGDATIAGHRCIRELAVGGSSSVYLAESERAGELVVLKILRNETERNSQLFARFSREYQLIAQIRHPNVVRVYEFGVADDHAYLAIEYFPLGDLRARMTQPLQPRAALRYLKQLAAALEIVHELGVLHRDLKPGNVMLRGDDSLALIDFGLAKQTSATDLTLTGKIFGTPHYSSPEQGHGEPVDARSDLYSLGVMFYEMLTGKKPFIATSPLAIIYMHRNAPRPTLTGELQSLQGLLDKLLASDPADRFQSASELLAAVEQTW